MFTVNAHGATLDLDMGSTELTPTTDKKDPTQETGRQLTLTQDRYLILGLARDALI